MNTPFRKASANAGLVVTRRQEPADNLSSERQSIEEERVSPESHHRPEPGIDPRRGDPRLRFLVVDDHSVVRHGATSWLQAQAGFTVAGEAATSREAIAQAILLKPDIVLLDVNLGDEGGLCAASKIVRTCPETRIVVFSASSDPVHVRGMIVAGVAAYVLKTSDPSVVLSAIQAVIAGSRFLDPALSDQVIEELATLPAASRRSRNVLTPREAQVLKCIVWGYTNRESAAELQIKTASVNTYRIRLCERLGLTRRAEIVRYGIAIGLMVTRPPSKHPSGSVLEPETVLHYKGEARGRC
ncbi:MAG: response regulator [Candidatus Sulfotelmatobacter sp.]